MDIGAYVTAGPGRQAKTLHRMRECRQLAKSPHEVVEVDPATLRVFVRCKYCYDNQGER